MGRREGCITAVNKSDCCRFFACLISSKFGIYQPSRQHCPFPLLSILTFHSSVLLPGYSNCLQQFRGFVEMPSTLLDSGLMHFSGLFTCVLSKQFPFPMFPVSCRVRVFAFHSVHMASRGLGEVGMFHDACCSRLSLSSSLF